VYRSVSQCSKLATPPGGGFRRVDWLVEVLMNPTSICQRWNDVAKGTSLPDVPLASTN
jgi:hypothetical protein